MVTPFVGVWIETKGHEYIIFETAVTPFVGVWIETFLSYRTDIGNQVTPFVGVWIETLSNVSYSSGVTSHTLRGCVD